MSKIIMVRHIPIISVMNVLLELLKEGEEFVDFECELNPTQDMLGIAPHDPERKHPTGKKINIDQEQSNYFDSLINPKEDGRSEE